MKKATRQLRAAAEATPRPLRQIVEDIRRGVEEYARHPDVTPNNIDFLLMCVSVMECEVELRPGEVASAEDQQGYRELARAFAAIRRWYYLLPRELFQEWDDWTNELESEANWQSQPELIEMLYPILLRQLKEKKWEGWRSAQAAAAKLAAERKGAA
ncbi:MAG TPA: hypothetical protein VFD58_00885 [Blastocatellia bacterium]|nr:hypothetical protein [Blastocatellia bacterium]